MNAGQIKLVSPETDMTKTAWLGLAAILCIAAAFRAFGISSGLPFLYDPDEAVFVSRAGSILANRDFNPHFFGHPGTTTIYLLSVLYALIYLVGSAFGVYHGPESFKNSYFQDPTLFYLSGRILFALFGIATVYLLYRTVNRAFGARVGLVSALVLALSPVHVEFSRLIRTDILMTFFLVIVLWFCLDIIEKHDGRSHFRAGFFLGLAVVTKYPAAVGAMMIVAASFFRNPRPVSALRQIPVSAAACVLAMFAGSPFLFIDIRSVLSDFRAERLHVTLGGAGDGFFSNMLWYLRGPLLHDFSVPGTAFAAIGIYSLISSHEKGRRLFLVFPVLFLCFIASLKIRWARWIIPLVPFIAVFAAAGFAGLAARNRPGISGRWKNTASAALFLLLIVPMVRLDVLEGLMASRKSTHTLARDWIVKNIPRGSRLLVEENTCHLPKNDYAFFIVDAKGNCVQVDAASAPEAVFNPPPVFAGRLADPGKISEMKIDYFVLGNWVDRFREESRRFPGDSEILDNYEKIMSLGDKIYEVSRITHYNQGPTVRVYRVRSARSGARGPG
jgi:4-amino-4-deoxy-L-arabinose transferase-like glycosyltransferase